MIKFRSITEGLIAYPDGSLSRFRFPVQVHRVQAGRAAGNCGLSPTTPPSLPSIRRVPVISPWRVACVPGYGLVSRCTAVGGGLRGASRYPRCRLNGVPFRPFPLLLSFSALSRKYPRWRVSRKATGLIRFLLRIIDTYGIGLQLIENIIRRRWIQERGTIPIPLEIRWERESVERTNRGLPASCRDNSTPLASSTVRIIISTSSRRRISGIIAASVTTIHPRNYSLPAKYDVCMSNLPSFFALPLFTTCRDKPFVSILRIYVMRISFLNDSVFISGWSPDRRAWESSLCR